MRIRFIIFGVATLFLLGLVWIFLPAQLPTVELTIKPAAYADTPAVAAAPLSMISISMDVSLSELEQLLNQKLAKKLAERDESGRKKDVRVEIAQNGAASLRGKGSVLEMLIPLKFKTHGKFKTSGKITVVSDVGLALREDWTPKVDIRSRFNWDRKPYIKLGPFKLRIAGLVEGKIKDALHDLDKDLREKAAKKLDLRKKAEPAWAKLYEPHPLKTTPPLWLLAEPSAVYMAPLMADASNVHVALGMSARLSTSANPRQLPPAPLPPLKQKMPEQRGFVLRLPLILDYPALVSKLKTKLVGRRIRLEKGSVTPTDLEIYTSGKNLVVGVSFKGDAPGWWLDTQGTVYFTGEPAYDPKSRVLSIRNFQYTRQVDNPLVHTATWVLHDALREKLERRTSWDLTAAIEKFRSDAGGYLNRSLGKDVEMTGTLDDLNIDNLDLLADGIAVHLEARGQLIFRFADDSGPASPGPQN